jgi:hypothetical protein
MSTQSTPQVPTPPELLDQVRDNEKMGSDSI